MIINEIQFNTVRISTVFGGTYTRASSAPSELIWADEDKGTIADPNAAKILEKEYQNLMSDIRDRLEFGLGDDSVRVIRT